MTPKVVLVTGGSRGIGKAIVELFHHQGWKVATCATSQEGLNGSVADFGIVCDVRKSTQVKTMIDQVIQNLGRIDAIVNNAGLAGSTFLDAEGSDDEWHRIIEVNLHGTYYVCKYALPHLLNTTGRIINIGSVLSLKGVPESTAYCAAKHAVLGFTRALAHQLAPQKITVNTICPGWVRTDMAAERMNEIGISEKELGKSVPMGRFVEPQEVADLAFFLANSSAAAMITGQALTIDGGTLA